MCHRSSKVSNANPVDRRRDSHRYTGCSRRANRIGLGKVRTLGPKQGQAKERGRGRKAGWFAGEQGTWVWFGAREHSEENCYRSQARWITRGRSKRVKIPVKPEQGQVKGRQGRAQVVRQETAGKSCMRNNKEQPFVSCQRFSKKSC